MAREGPNNIPPSPLEVPPNPGELAREQVEHVAAGAAPIEIVSPIPEPEEKEVAGQLDASYELAPPAQEYAPDGLGAVVEAAQRAEVPVETAPQEIQPDEVPREPDASQGSAEPEAPPVPPFIVGGAYAEAPPASARVETSELKTGEPPPLESVLGSGARNIFHDLPEQVKGPVREYFEAQRKRVQDAVMAKLLTFRSKTFDRLTGELKRGEEERARRSHDLAAAKVEAIKHNIEFLERNGLLPSQAHAELEEQQRQFEQEAEQHRQKLADVSSERDAFEKKRDAVAHTVAGHCEDRIGRNAYKIHASEQKIHEFDIDLDANAIDLKDARARLEEFNRERDTSPSEIAKRLLQEPIREYGLLVGDLSRRVDQLKVQKVKEEARLADLRIKDTDLHQLLSKILGRDSKEAVSGVAKSVPGAGGKERGGDEARRERESLSEFFHHVGEWNRRYGPGLRITVTEGLDDLLSRREAAAKIEKFLKIKYSKSKYQSKLQAFQRELP